MTAIAVGLGAGADRDRPPRPGAERPARARAAWWALAVIAAVLALGAAMAAAGLPLHYLPPGHWDELGARLDPALARINEIDVPYKGGATWVEMAILLPAPPLLTWLAAVLAFWPLRDATGARRQLRGARRPAGPSLRRSRSAGTAAPERWDSACALLG